MENKENKLSKAKIKQNLKEFDLKLKNIQINKKLLGVEGSFSKDFFQKYFKNADWYRRMPRCKCDINNILLDIGYTYLFNLIDALLRLHGFDTYKGIYHKLFFQRKSLSCDIVEPFRCIIDKALLKAHNLNQINEKDFKSQNGKFYLSYDKQKPYTQLFLKAIMERKEDIFKYVKEFYFCILNEKTDYPFFKFN
jgi:CRISPR-associated protein Cas1